MLKLADNKGGANLTGSGDPAEMYGIVCCKKEKERMRGPCQTWVAMLLHTLYNMWIGSAEADPTTQVRSSCVTSRQKALLFGLIRAAYEPHELTHGVAVVVRRPEGVLRHSPPRRKDHKVRHSCTYSVRAQGLG